MPFDYYENLKPSHKAIYRKSDGIAGFELELTPELASTVEAVREAIRGK